jgi:hypothetical protein
LALLIYQGEDEGNAADGYFSSAAIIEFDEPR